MITRQIRLSVLFIACSQSIFLMDTLLSQLVCSVVALLVYKYVETVQEEAPGSYTWPHRSSLTILIRPKEILIKVFKHQPSNVQFKFTLLGVCIKIFLAIAKSSHLPISRETQQKKNHFRWEKRHKLSEFFLDPLEEKIHHGLSLREAKASKTSSVSVPISCSLFEASFEQDQLEEREVRTTKSSSNSTRMICPS